jgi:hypothetical protein
VSFVDYLKKEIEKEDKGGYRNHQFISMLKYKISILQDSPTLDGRLEILSHVIRDRPETKLDVLLVIRQRQCGVLRWMVENKLVDLNVNSRSAGLVLEDLRFIKLVPSMPLGSFLCFAAVEYDDLFSLQWLCETIGYPTLSCDGMNLLHLASLLGRLEIVGWLHHATTVWNALASSPCGHKELSGAYAVHIAAGHGHLCVTEMLLKFKCNECDKNGKLPEHYAERAPVLAAASLKRDYKFAHDWAKSRSGEVRLEPEHEESVRKLLELLKKKKSFKFLKTHIVNTKCMNIETWYTKYDYYDHKGSNGLSYGDIVNECLSFHDVRFVEWLIMLMRLPHDQHEWFWRESRLAEKDMGQDDLMVWAKENNYNEIDEALSHRLIHGIATIDTKNESVFSLESMQSNHELSLRLQFKLTRIRTVIKIARSISSRIISDIALKGGNPSELMELTTMYRDLRNFLEAEGMFSAELVDKVYDLQMISTHEDLIEMGREREYIVCL